MSDKKPIQSAIELWKQTLAYMEDRLTQHQLTEVNSSDCEFCKRTKKYIDVLKARIREEEMRCPSCKTCDGQFLEHENGTIVQCTWCHNKFRRINDNWVFWGSPVLIQDNETPIVPRSKVSHNENAAKLA